VEFIKDFCHIHHTVLAFMLTQVDVSQVSCWNYFPTGLKTFRAGRISLQKGIICQFGMFCHSITHQSIVLE